MTMSWSRVARRIRVPMGFLFAVLFLWLAKPTLLFVVLSLALVAPGLALRGYASGYVKKNAELTMTGPYAHTRNPLYLGSIMIAFGFALAARSIWIAVALVILFAAIYVPVIRSEEEYLRGVFPEFDAYAASVPRLLPRIAVSDRSKEASAGFSGALYGKHREYNALVGAAGVYAALILKMVLLKK